MKAPKAIFKTAIIMLIATLAVIVWDVVLAIKGKGNTVSQATLYYSCMTAAVPWCLGFLSGHLFTYRDKRPLKLWVSLLIGLGTALIVGIVTYFLKKDILPLWYLYPASILGSFTWYQRKTNGKKTAKR